MREGDACGPPLVLLLLLGFLLDPCGCLELLLEGDLVGEGASGRGGWLSSPSWDEGWFLDDFLEKSFIPSGGVERFPFPGVPKEEGPSRGEGPQKRIRLTGVWRPSVSGEGGFLPRWWDGRRETFFFFFFFLERFWQAGVALVCRVMPCIPMAKKKSWEDSMAC